MKLSHKLLLMFSLIAGLTAHGQKVTMYIPYQFAMDIDTNIWAVPYLVPQPSDYTEQITTEIYHKPTALMVVLQIHQAGAKDDRSAFAQNALRKHHNPFGTTTNFVSVHQNALHSEIHVYNERPIYVRGYQDFDSRFALTYHFLPKGDTLLCHLQCQAISEALHSLRLVEPKEIDQAAGLPRDYSKGMTAVREDVYKQIRARMQLHAYHAKFYLRDFDSYWFTMTRDKLFTDTAKFDAMCLPASKKTFSFQHVAEELHLLEHLPLPDDVAVNYFLLSQEAVHDSFRNESRLHATRYLSEKIGKQLGVRVDVSSNVTGLTYTDDIKYLSGTNLNQSYFIVAMRTTKGWEFYPTLVNELEENMSNKTIRRNFLGTDGYGPPDRTYVLRMPSPTTERTFAFGLVPKYRMVHEKYIGGISKRFVIPTNLSANTPTFLPTFNTMAYDATFEMMPPVANDIHFMSPPFVHQTTRNKENLKYSIHYLDEEKLLNSRINTYQKIGVDDPTRRAYITAMHVTDYNRNGLQEIWYALVSNGRVVEIHGLESTKKGLVPLVITEAFRSLIQLENQVSQLLALSTEKQDPFQREPIMGTTGMGSGNGGGYSPAQYERIYSRESIEMEGEFDDIAVPVLAEEESLKNEPLSFAEQMPIYPGGVTQMNNDIAANLIYPAEEKESAIQGTVYVQLVVEKDGTVTNIKTVRGIPGGNNLSKAAEESVAKLKPFAPAQQNGNPVRIQMTVPIKFKLN